MAQQLFSLYFPSYGAVELMCNAAHCHLLCKPDCCRVFQCSAGYHLSRTWLVCAPSLKCVKRGCESELDISCFFPSLPLRLSDWPVLGSVGSNAVRDFAGAAGAKHSPTTVEDWVQLKFGLFLQTQLVHGSEASEGQYPYCCTLWVLFFSWGVFSERAEIWRMPLTFECVALCHGGGLLLPAQSTVSLQRIQHSY